MANYYSTDYNKILEEETAALENLKKKQQDTINKTHDNKISSEKDIYGKAIDDAKVAYESEYQKNAVQKLINEKQIAERNANLGLTDSGLNRTQQTAVQLGYANQKGNIDLAKQKTLDTLSQNLATSLANIEQSRITSLSKLDTNIQSQAQSNAMNRYNTNVEANTKMFSASKQAEVDMYKARLNAPKTNVLNNENTTLGNMQGSLAQNKVNSIHNADGSTTYTDCVTGISVTYDAGVNPFTGNNNLIENTDTAKAAEEYGTFSNGYQPKGIIGYSELEDSGHKDVINGRTVTIWKTSDGTSWVWDDNSNKYVSYAQAHNFDKFGIDEWNEYFLEIRKSEGAEALLSDLSRLRMLGGIAEKYVTRGFEIATAADEEVNEYE